MRIGISILTGTGQHVWNNGLTQNIYHLARLLSHIPFVDEVILLNCGDSDQHVPGSDAFGLQLKMLRPQDATDFIDVAIEMGGALDPEWLRRFRARGGRVAFHICGQPYAALVEATMFHPSGFFGDPQRCDEVWLLPKDEAFVAMLRSIHRCPVHVTPYLWAPEILQATIQPSDSGAVSFGYQPGSLAVRARAAIFEPNISPIKMGLIPMLICESANSLSPGAIGHVDFMNGQHMASHATFVSFMRNLALYRDGHTSIAGRDYFAHIMGRGANLVVSHQMGCAQNYLYLDALYGSYPLIHNSPLFRDVGYYYEASDVAGGASMLLQAIASHDDNLTAYQSAARALIDSLAPQARANIDAYARRLIALTSTVKS